MLFFRRCLWMAVLVCAACVQARAQTPVAWLRYAIPPDPPRYHDLPHAVVLLGNAAGVAAPEEMAAADELDRGLGHMVAGTDLLLHRFDPRLDAMVLGTTDAVHRARLGRSLPGWVEKPLPEEGFRIVHLRRGIRQWYILQGGSPRAVLWAAFRFAALVAEDQQLPEDLTDTPAMGLRAVDLGQGGDALERLRDGPQHTGLARLLASVGINGIFADADAVVAAQLAGVIRPYGMRLWVRGAEGFSAEQLAGLGGALVRVPKHADLAALRIAVTGANAQARLLRRAGGSVVLEGALGAPLREAGAKEATPEERAEVLRGGLEANVVLLGAAVPSSMPLAGLGSANFGLLPGSPQVAAFDVFPEATGGLAFPAAAWASALQTPEKGVRGESTLAAVLRGAGESSGHSGVVGLMSDRSVEAMLQQPLLQANLYAFGRVAWCPTMRVEAATDEWSRQTWGDDARAHAVATRVLLASAEAAVANSSPFGLPLLARAGGVPDPAEAAHWYVGPLPLADSSGIGVDRMGEAGRYPEGLARRLGDVSQTPEAWLLAFHRLPYTYPMKSGATLAQSFYDVHFAGASAAANAMDEWESVRGLVDEGRFSAVRAFLVHAATRAEIWREVSTEWMQRTSGVADTFGFVGSHPGRVEAEAMQGSGYAVRKTGLDAASGGAVVDCGAAACSVSTAFQGAENVYRVEVGYVEEQAGCSFALLVNGVVRARWTVPPGSDRTAVAERFVANGVRLKAGDTIKLEAVTAAGGKAPLDFVEITRDPRWN